MPVVSVVIPTYNNASVVPRAIDSVLAQTFADREIIVVNDGSTDHTLAVLESYEDRIIVLHQPNQERAVARNHGVQHAKGSYIAFLDDDDWWHPRKLEKQIGLLGQDRSVGLAYSWAYRVAPDGSTVGMIGRSFPSSVGASDMLPWFFLGFSIPTLTAIISREIFLLAGGFDSDICYIEDWDLWMRASVFAKVACVPEPLAYYQLHNRNMPITFDRYDMQDGRLRVLQRIENLIDTLGMTDRLSQATRQRGLARAYWYGALIDYAVHKIDSAQYRATQALVSDPGFFYDHSQDSASEMLVGFAVSLSDLRVTYGQALTFVNKVLASLPNEFDEWLSYRKILGALSMWYGHQAYQDHQLREARSFMLHALHTDPHLLTNRGLVSILFRSMARLEKP